MIGYEPMLGLVRLTTPRSYRPPTYIPSLTLSRRPQMGQKGTLAAMGAIPLLVGTALSGVLAWGGFLVGSKERGLPSAIGYIFGVLGALGAVGGLTATGLWLLGVSMMPEPVPPTPPWPPLAAPILPEVQMPETPRMPTFPSMMA